MSDHPRKNADLEGFDEPSRRSTVSMLKQMAEDDQAALTMARYMLHRFADEEEMREQYRQHGFGEGLPHAIAPDLIRRVADRLEGIRNRLAGFRSEDEG